MFPHFLVAIADLTHPLSNNRSSIRIIGCYVTTSTPSPDKEECEVTPSDADIPDSIARALLDPLREKQSGNQLPASMISLARVGGPQLQQCLVTGRNHQV